MNTNHRAPRQTTQKTSRERRKSNSLKVVYISSPMKVKTSAARFRSLVQQLTGKNSDISQYMDNDDNNNNSNSNDQSIGFFETVDGCLTSVTSQEDTPTSSESFPEQVDSVFASLLTEQFEGIFSSSDISLYDPAEMDVLGSFDELL